MPTYIYRTMPTSLSLDGLGLTLPVLAEEHPNRAPFRGVLTRLDEPSTRPPNGSQSHRVLIPTSVAQMALPSLIGMGVNVAFGLRDHNKQAKIGIITSAEVVGKDLVVEGYLFAKDFPQEVATIRANPTVLGMSYELTQVEVEDPEAEVWILQGFVFTGAAILLKQAAAYHQTSIIAAAAQGARMSKLLDELHKISQQLATLEAAEEDESEAAEEEEASQDEEEAEADTEAAEEDEEGQSDEEAATEALLASMQKIVTRLEGSKRKKTTLTAAKASKGLDERSRLLSVFMRAMTYPGGPFSGEHDDETEDIALFKKLMQQHKAVQASATQTATAQAVKDLQASMGLITDLLKRQTGLITDLLKTGRGLATDSGNGGSPAQGGPVRKTMSAAGHEVWISKFQGQDQAATAPAADAAIDAQLDAEGITDARLRMARKLELQWNTVHPGVVQ